MTWEMCTVKGCGSGKQVRTYSSTGVGTPAQKTGMILFEGIVLMCFRSRSACRFFNQVHSPQRHRKRPTKDHACGLADAHANPMIVEANQQPDETVGGLYFRRYVI